MNSENKSIKYLTLSEAAKISGISRDYLNVLIRRGKLQAVKDGKNWLVAEEWLDNCKLYRKEGGKIENGYLSLFDASKIANVGAGYLNVAVRRGRLKAVKLGRNWFTKKEWVDEYRQAADIFHLNKFGGKNIAAEILAGAEKAELENLKARLIAESAAAKAAADKKELTERLHQVELKIEKASSRRFETEKNFKAVAESGVKLTARNLGLDEKNKILAAAAQSAWLESPDELEFQRATRLFGSKRFLKSWRHFKFTFASGVAAAAVAVFIGVISGVLIFPDFGVSKFNADIGSNKYPAGIFSIAFGGFANDLPPFYDWLASGADKAIAFLKSKSVSELQIGEENLETGAPQIAKPQPAAPAINTLAEAEALDSPMAGGEASGIAGAAPSGATGVSFASGAEFKLLENRLSIVETNLQNQSDLANAELSLQKQTILGALNAMLGIAALTPNYPISSVVVQGQPATLTTYSIAPQINTGFDRLSATYLNIASDAAIKGSLTVSSGIHTNTLAVSGDSTLSGNATIAGTLSVAGDTSMGNLSLTGTVNGVNSQFNMGNASTTSNLSVAGNEWVSGNLTISGASAFNGASTTNGTITNFWSTNGTIVNASTTYLTVGNNFWGNNGLFSSAIQTPLVWNSGPLTASTTGANPIIFAASSTEAMRIAPTGYIGIGTTTPSQTLSIVGSQFIYNGGLGIGVSTTTSGAFQTTGDASIGGNLYVAGNSATIGGSSANTLTVNSSINSNLIPDQNIVRDLGSTAKYWNNAYIGTLTANNISAASTTIGGTQSSTFTINSDNASADSENSSLIFFRGTVVPNAILAWNSATSSKRFEFNQPLYIDNGSASTTNPTFTVQTIANQTANALQVIDNNAAGVFSVNPVGDNTTMVNASTTNLTVSGSAWFSSNGTTTFGGAVLLGDGSAAAPSLAFTNDTASGLYRPGAGEMGFTTGGTNRLIIDSAGNVGIGTTAPGYSLTIGNSSNSNTIYFDDTQTYAPQLNMKNSGGTWVTWSGYQSSPYMGTISGTPFYFVTNNAYRWGVSAAGGVSIGANYYNQDAGANNLIVQGNVGIGTTSPGSLLSVNSTGNVYFGGNLTVSGNSIFTNASTTNGTITNFWSTNGTIADFTTTNASTTYATLPTFWSTNGTITNASSTYQTVSDTAWINTLNLTNTLAVSSGGTGAASLSGLLQGNGTGAITGITGTAGQIPYYNGTNTLLATSTIYLSTAGNVGIGTTSPDNLLTLAGAATPSLGFTTNSGLSGWTMGIDTADANKFKIASSTAVGTNTRLTIDGNGKVGIGTTHPEQTLTVFQNTASNTAAFIVDASPTGYASLYLGHASASSSIAFYNNNYQSSELANNLVLQTGLTAGGTSSILLMPQGNVGIGTASPGGKLDVLGSGENATDILTLGNDKTIARYIRFNSGKGAYDYAASDNQPYALVLGTAGGVSAPGSSLFTAGTTILAANTACSSGRKSCLQYQIIGQFG